MHSNPCPVPNWSLCLSIWAWIWSDIIWEPNWNEHQGKAFSRVFERNRLCDTRCRKMASRILQLVFSPAKSRFWHFSWSLWRRRWLSYSHMIELWKAIRTDENSNFYELWLYSVHKKFQASPYLVRGLFKVTLTDSTCSDVTETVIEVLQYTMELLTISQVKSGEALWLKLQFVVYKSKSRFWLAE